MSTPIRVGDVVLFASVEATWYEVWVRLNGTHFFVKSVDDDAGTFVPERLDGRPIQWDKAFVSPESKGVSLGHVVKDEFMSLTNRALQTKGACNESSRETG